MSGGSDPKPPCRLAGLTGQRQGRRCERPPGHTTLNPPGAESASARRSSCVTGSGSGAGSRAGREAWGRVQLSGPN